MLSIGTVFTVGGIGLGFAAMEMLFKALGKESLGMIISVIGTCVLGYFAYNVINDFFHFLQTWVNNF